MTQFSVLAGVKLPDYVKMYLESFCSCEYCDANHLPRTELLGKLKGKDAVIILGTKVDREFFDAAPSDDENLYGLDVFEKEPVPMNHPLLQLENVVLTPHIGSATRRTREEMAMLGVKNVKGILEEGKAITPVF